MIEELTTKEQVEQLVKEHLDCPCTCFPPMKDNAPILDVYYQARERGKREGFTPLLIVLDPWGNPVNLFHCQKEFWQKAASEPVEDGRALLHRFEAELRKEWGEDLTSKELEERLCEVRQLIQGERALDQEHSGFGLFNINERIRLYYGPEYGLSAESSYLEGTQMQVVLPCVKN